MLVAAGVYLVTTLALCWPMLAGRFLVNPLSDQYSAGYAFRAFGAEVFRATGGIPEWNPFIFGGLPFIAAMHGDIFYPTAWLRWFLPVDLAMNLGLAFHLLLAGLAMFALLRGLGFRFAGAITGGIAYQLSGIVASLVNPGHDGKLFVSALAPLVLLALVHGVRHRRVGAFGVLALLVGLCMLSPHYQMTYYLLVAAGFWTLWLTFLDPLRPKQSPLRPLGLGLLAVVLGVAVSAVQALPFLEYIPYSPRSAEGASRGWDYATSYSFPIAELPTTLLPQFNGVIESYWGTNPIKLHTEYLGALVLGLAVLAWGQRPQRPDLTALAAIGGFFLLVAFGGHTPFYRLWYEVMPMMKSVRAPGMAFLLVALPVAAWAGAGAERLLAGGVKPRTALITFGTMAAIGLLGAAGLLQPVAEAVAHPARLEAAMANALELRAGGLRLLVFAVMGAAVAWGIATRKIQGMPALTLLALLTGADLWTIDRLFFRYSRPAAELYAPDAITSHLRATPLPWRVLSVGEAYPHSFLMGLDIPQVLGYHGNELRFYDDLLGGKNVWANLNAGPPLWDLLAARFLILPGEQAIPGFTKVLGPVPVTPGGSAVLYQRDSVPPYARVVPAAVKVPEAQVVPTVVDPRFPKELVALYPDTSSVSAPGVQGSLPQPSAVRVRVTDWGPGHMALALEGDDPRPGWLVVSENWYPDWRATVDGQAAAVHRAQGSFLSVALAPGARQVSLQFVSGSYRTGRLVSLVAVLLSLAAVVVPAFRRRGAARG
jgi:hypothetical protein